MNPNTFRIAVRKFGPFESAIVKQWAAFEAEEKTGLQLEAVPMDLHPLLENTLEKGSGCDYDIAFVNTDFLAFAHHKQALCDLAEFLKKDPPEGYPEGWTTSLLGLQNIGGQILGLPYHDGPECFIYRKDLLLQAGLEVPQTWSNFCATARQLQRPQENVYGTVFAAFPDGHNTVYDFCLQVWTRGGDVVDSQGRICLDTSHAREALHFLRESINDSSMVHPACREMDSVKSGMAFAAGEVALMVNWFGFAAMAEVIPESRVKGNVGVAPLPHVPGVPSASLNIYWVLSIPTGAPHKDMAWRFLRHCASAGMDRLLTLEGGIGCRKSTWLDADVNRTIPFYRDMEGLHASARVMPRLREWPEIGSVIDRMVTAALNTHQDVAALTARAQAKVEILAEEEGFEPPEPFRVQRFSSA